MAAEEIFAGLNDEQRAAVEATRGCVCILAGAGTGKTTTITRRIAWQVASGAFAPGELVAVTFTDKAAGELRSRLAALGVSGVRASTFHSAALALLRRFHGDPGRILSTKALLLRQIGNRLPAPYKFRPAGDLATEIEWAKNRRLTPQTYVDGLDGHEPVNLVHGETRPLAAGMCFSDEPGIYIPGEFGVRLEDCFHVTAGGPRLFTELSPSIEKPFG